MSNFPLPLEVVAFKATLILIGAMLIAMALRRASGNSRHTLWTATTVALLALPILEAQLPRLPMAWLPQAPQASAASSSELPDVVATAATGGRLASGITDQLVEVAGPTTTAAVPRGLGFWLAAIWLFGIIGFAIPVVIGVRRSRRLIQLAPLTTNARLLQHFDRARDEVSVTGEVALRVSPVVRTPMTGGVLYPVVLLPETALEWADDCLDAVLRHELVHVRQHDALRQLASRLSVALYWFHPLAWRAARLGALAREMACDESVLRLGTRPSRYARHLLALADPLSAPIVTPALVRLDHPQLEERVMAILRASPPPASRRLSIVAALFIFSWTVLVAAAAPANRTDVTATGTGVSEEYPVEFAGGAPELAALAELPMLEELDELPQLATADCEPDRDSRTRSVSGGNGPVRMFTTDHQGTRICVTVRGDNAERDELFPRGRLPNGVMLTMASSNADGERRLEIQGGSGGNVHRWYVDGRERPFDAAAGAWRDAMLDLVGVLTERNRANEREAVRAEGRAMNAMEAARASSEDAMRRAVEVEGRALARSRVGEEVAARVARDIEGHQAQLAEVRAAREQAVAGHLAEREATMAAREISAHQRRAMVAAERDAEVAVARGVGGRGVVAPRAGGVGVGTEVELRRSLEERQVRSQDVLREHQRALEQRHVQLRERAAELREHAEQMAREHRDQIDEVRHAAPVVTPDTPRGVGAREVPTRVGRPVVAPDVPRGVGVREVPVRAGRPAIAPRVPSRDREVTPREIEAAERLRAAIRATGET